MEGENEKTPAEVGLPGSQQPSFPLGGQRRLPTGNLARTALPSRAEKNAIQRSNIERGPTFCAIDSPGAWHDYKKRTYLKIA